MPYAADKIDDHDIEVCPKLSLPVPAKGDIDICPEKSGERHMPPFPELHNGRCLIWGIKIDRQLYIKQMTDPCGHVSIPAEIKVQLERIRERNQQGFHGAECLYRAESP